MSFPLAHLTRPSPSVPDQEPAPTTVPERAADGEPFDVRRVKLPGRCELEYVERGDADAPAVIFLHGLTDSWLSFAEVLKRCPGDLRCIAISQRGHGDSERPATGYGLGDLAGDVVAFMDVLGLETATVIGHSMGSLVAQTVAAAHPQRVTRLALVGSATTFDSAATREFEEVLRTLEEIPRELAHEFQVGTVCVPLSEAVLAAFVDESMKVPARVWRDALAGVLAHDGRRTLEAIEAPTALFWGAHDAYCTREEQDRLLASIANCRLTIYEDLAHAPHWEDPDRLTRDLVAFALGR